MTKFKAGDRVTFDSTVYCGECEFCLQGEINLCNNRQVIGVSCGDYRRAGAFAEYVVVPQRIAYHLPDALEFQEAAMLEAVSVALHAVRVSEMKGGETALVIGAGMIGLLTLQAAKAGGASKVLVADIDRTRLETAKNIGADETLLLSGSELVKEILRRTDGRGVDLVLEAVGREETIAASIASVRKGGTVTLIGNISPEVKIPLQVVVSTADSPAGIVCLVGRISSGNGVAGQRKNQSEVVDYRGCSSERWSAMVCPAARGRAKSDESGARSGRIDHSLANFCDAARSG